MKKILITGGSGFIGTNLIDFYLKKDIKLLNLDIKPPMNNKHYQQWVRCDVTDLIDLEKHVNKFRPDIIFHLAARTDLNGKDINDYHANTLGVQNIILAISNKDFVKKVFFASSRLVCKVGHTPKNENDYCPTTPYGESKVVGEKIIKKMQYKLNCQFIILRITSIWGPWFSTPYRDFFNQIYKKRYFHPKGILILKSFGFVGNTIYQLDKLSRVNLKKMPKIIYLCDYPPVNLYNFAELISKSMHKGKIFSLNLFVLKFISIIGSLFFFLGYKKIPLTRFRLTNLLTNMIYDTEPLEKIVGPLPYSLNEGISKTISWINNFE